MSSLMEKMVQMAEVKQDESHAFPGRRLRTWTEMWNWSIKKEGECFLRQGEGQAQCTA